MFGETHKMATTNILEQMIALEESPWGDLKGKPLDARRLSSFLKPYGVGPKLLRDGEDVFKGYERADLIDPWSRYLPASASASPIPHEPVTTVTKGMTEDDELFFAEEDVC